MTLDDVYAVASVNLEESVHRPHLLQTVLLSVFEGLADLVASLDFADLVTDA